MREWFWDAAMWAILVVCGLLLLAMGLAYHDIGPVRFVGGYPGFPGAMNREQLKLYRAKVKSDPEWAKRIYQQEYFPTSDLYPNPSTAQTGE